MHRAAKKLKETTITKLTRRVNASEFFASPETVSFCDTDLLDLSEVEVLDNDDFEIDLELMEEVYGSNDPIMVNYWELQAGLFLKSGKYSQAEPLYRRILAIQEKENGSNHKDVSNSLAKLAFLFRELGNYSESVQLYRRSLAIIEKTLEVEPSEVATALNSLAMMLGMSGNYTEALQHIRRSLTISETIYGTESSSVARTLGIQASLMHDSGSYSEAEQLYRRSLAIMEKVHRTKHPDVATVLNNLARLLNDLGNYSEAELLCRRSITIDENAYGSEDSEVAVTLQQLAGALRGLGNYSEAEEYGRRSLAIMEKVHGSEHPNTAVALYNLAYILEDLGRFREAKPLHLRSLMINEKFSGLEHPNVAFNLDRLAGLLIKLGNYDEAGLLVRRSLAIREKMFGPEHCYVALAMDYLACISGYVKRISSAILLAKRAVNIMQKVRQDVSSIDKAQLDRFDFTVEGYYKNLSSFLIKAGRYGEAEYVMGMLKEKEQFEILRSDSTPDLPVRLIGYNDAEMPVIEQFDTIVATLFKLGTKRETLQNIRVHTPEQNQELAKIKTALAQAEKELYDFLDNIHFTLPDSVDTHVDDESYKPIDITNAPPNSVLVTTVSAEEEFYTILVTPHGRIPFSTKIKSVELAEKVLKFRDELKDYESDTYLKSARELYNIIIRPMEQELFSGGITTILWMLNGALRLLPLSALHDGRQYMLEKFRNVCITTLSKIGTAEHEQWNGLGMGVTREYEGHSALEAVKDELEGIIRKDSNCGVIPGDILLDEQFTRESMESHLQHGYKVVHFASHFELNPVNDTLSYLLLGDGSKIRMDELRRNTRRFKGVELVAFSACSTGLGTASTRGREVDGIGYLGERQGAQTVLATLWPVEDKSTSMIMREFYRLREEGMTKAEAIQQAQLALLKGKLTSPDGHDFTHPYFWAPFILIGNG